ncbi:NAD/NADP-dependent octopine/nopaline dehydrogenase family protein [Crassaminicella profunda]|uniref:NAD/NADP-dependent octopine/nopaline dehydrogenase family protein n=1 Tax=Crassaminicella profunda TaxID=1286698 RepID=UPI001CA707BF|nr:NAD/NADP-dependent octopine/nopaline dehydrogenase family protein [Crassaminicella profunda]QZY54508.1 NAD/NADP octopine/nopaline dehydrogenase family protein [Crassaminicella profunda]
MSENKDLKWTIIGAGNGGQSVAGHLGLMGFDVSIYDICLEPINVIKKQGGVFLEGAVKGFGCVYATNDLEEALSGADIIMVITPALDHAQVAKDCAPYLKDNQMIVLHPGATFGALAFYKALKDENCKADTTIVETSTLIYACRLSKPGMACILGIKDRLQIAALPAVKTEEVVKILKSAYPQIEGLDNVMMTSLDNTNPMIHPPATLFSTSLVESNKDWLFYWDGITTAVGNFIEGMDHERLNIAEKLGYKMDAIKDQYRVEYHAEGENISEIFKNTDAYSGVYGQKTLETRYILEDIPMGLVPFVSLGKKLGVQVERMELIIKLSELMLQKDLTSYGRSFENMGLNKMSMDEIMNLIING